MSVEIAAIVDRVPRALPTAVRAIADGPYLLVEDAAGGRAPSAERLLARHALIDAASREVACLPCRYGGTLPDDAAALAWLAERRERVSGALARVKGRSEVDLRLRPAGPPRADPSLAGDGPGARYLREVAARYAVVDRALLEGIAERARAAVGGAADLIVDADGGHVAFLLARDEVAAFLATARASGIDRTLPDGVAARWSGPWPAYTFAAAWLGDGS